MLPGLMPNMPSMTVYQNASNTAAQTLFYYHCIVSGWSGHGLSVFTVPSHGDICDGLAKFLLGA